MFVVMVHGDHPDSACSGAPDLPRNGIDIDVASEIASHYSTNPGRWQISRDQSQQVIVMFNALGIWLRMFKTLHYTM